MMDVGIGEEVMYDHFVCCITRVEWIPKHILPVILAQLLAGQAEASDTNVSIAALCIRYLKPCVLGK